jgi:hypothetical protein
MSLSSKPIILASVAFLALGLNQLAQAEEGETGAADKFVTTLYSGKDYYNKKFGRKMPAGEEVIISDEALAKRAGVDVDTINRDRMIMIDGDGNYERFERVGFAHFPYEDKREVKIHGIEHSWYSTTRSYGRAETPEDRMLPLVDFFNDSNGGRKYFPGIEEDTQQGISRRWINFGYASSAQGAETADRDVGFQDRYYRVKYFIEDHPQTSLYHAWTLLVNEFRGTRINPKEAWLGDIYARVVQDYPGIKNVDKLHAWALAQIEEQADFWRDLESRRPGAGMAALRQQILDVVAFTGKLSSEEVLKIAEIQDVVLGQIGTSTTSPAVRTAQALKRIIGNGGLEVQNLVKGATVRDDCAVSLLYLAYLI